MLAMPRDVDRVSLALRKPFSKIPPVFLAGPSKQFCVTATLQGVKDTAGLTDQNSDNFKQVKQIVLLELDRVLTAKNWKGRLNPPPELVRFE